jgi:hypothetical protein
MNDGGGASRGGDGIGGGDGAANDSGATSSDEETFDPLPAFAAAFFLLNASSFSRPAARIASLLFFGGIATEPRRRAVRHDAPEPMRRRREERPRITYRLLGAPVQSVRTPEIFSARRV